MHSETYLKFEFKFLKVKYIKYTHLPLIAASFKRREYRKQTLAENFLSCLRQLDKLTFLLFDNYENLDPYHVPHVKR